MAWRCITFVCLLISCEVSAASLRVLSWGGEFQKVQSELLFKPYEKKTRVTILEQSYRGEMGKLAPKNNRQNYDLALVETQDLIKGCKLGYFEKVNFDKLGGRFRFEPGTSHTCGIPAMLWSMVLVYRKDYDTLTTRAPLWRDFFQKRYAGKRLLRNTPEMTMEIALLSDGVPEGKVYFLLNSHLGIQRAIKHLEKHRDVILWWKHPDEALKHLKTQDVVFAALDNGTFQTHADDFPKHTFTFRGQFITKDYWALARKSSEMKRAYDLLKFLTSPQVSAVLSQKTFYAPSVRKASKLLSKDERAALLTDPQNTLGSFRFKPQFWAKEGARARAAFYAWQGLQKNAKVPLGLGAILAENFLK